MERILKNGDGWRIGWNPQAEIYKGLVGNEEWAIELTEAEFNDFCRLLTQLAETMGQMQEELMEQERIAIEAESDLIWLEIEGYPHLYSLRLIIHEHRRCEGNWAEGAANRLVAAIPILKIF
jgi:predicted GNAT superfamily acetyltransferase